jgi:hypothetical protein
MGSSARENLMQSTRHYVAMLIIVIWLTLAYPCQHVYLIIACLLHTLRSSFSILLCSHYASHHPFGYV